MGLVALLFAHHGIVGEAEPFAAAEVAGLTLLERQVRLVRSLGAERVFVLAERMPPRLATALSRTNATVLRDAALIGNKLESGDRVLVLEEGLLIDEAAARLFVEHADRLMLAVGDGEPPYPQAERLDSATFWAGLAVYPSRLVVNVAADLGEWDLQSTLLRAAVAEGAGRLALDAALVSIRDGRDAQAAAKALSDATATAGEDWPSRWLYPPVERIALKALLTRRIAAHWLTIGALAAAGLAVLTVALAWPAAGLILMLLSDPLLSIGDRLARVRLEPPAGASAIRLLDQFMEPAWYLALGASLAGADTGPFVWAAAVVAFRRAADRQRPLDRGLGGGRLVLFGASRRTMLWALLPFAIFGAWVWGLAALAVYAAASFFRLQSRALRDGNG